MTTPNLYLLDGMALIYRAHFVFVNNPIRNSKGVNTSAAYGFTNTLLEIIQSHQPTHLAVAFDTSAPTARHTAFPEYKAQREEMPEELSDAIPVVKDLLRAFRIPILELDGYEADDLIGTLAVRAAEAGMQTTMVTPDKDFGQLVTDRIRMLRPGRKGGDIEILGPAEVCAKWGVSNPRHVIDCLGLIGDAVDNIPGVPGIGPKTAEKLLAQYQSLENLLDHTAELKGKLRESIEHYADQARLSKELATIDTAVPLEISPEDLVCTTPDTEALKTLFIELEFNTLGKRLFGSSFHAGHGAPARANPASNPAPSLPADDLFATSPTSETSAPPEPTETAIPQFKTFDEHLQNYRIVDHPETLGELGRLLSGITAFSFDTETDGLNPRESRLVGISLSWQSHTGWYIPVHSTHPDAPAPLDPTLITSTLLPHFTNRSILKIAHNAKFDLAALRCFFNTHSTDSKPIPEMDPIFDTMIAHALIAPDQRHGMDALSESLLGYRPISITTLLGDKNATPARLMSQAEPSAIARYAAEDADVTWQLYQVLLPQLQASGQESVFNDIEMPVLPAIEAMEAAGITLEIQALESFSRQLADRIESQREAIESAAGEPFNLNSPKQLGVILFDKLNLAAKAKKTRTGQYKTDEQTLSDLAHTHPIIPLILDYRMMTKLKNTYVDALPAAVSPRTGRVHTTYQQAATTTGRLASSDPNLQNIPIRSELGKEIRRAFIASPGNILLSADYSQIELRILAAVTRDPGLIQAFTDRLDIHAATAARVFRVALDEVNPEQRRQAKMVNFGISYGISAFGLSQRLGISRTEAAEIIKNYFDQFPGIKDYIDSTIASCRELGYVETLSGRRRQLPDIRSANPTVRAGAERNAINMPIQGTAADLIKIAMARIHHDLIEQQLSSRMLLQVHDELVFEIPPDEEPALRAIIEPRMTRALPALNEIVPVEIEIGTGSDWLTAH